MKFQCAQDALKTIRLTLITSQARRVSLSDRVFMHSGFFKQNNSEEHRYLQSSRQTINCHSFAQVVEEVPTATEEGVGLRAGVFVTACAMAGSAMTASAVQPSILVAGDVIVIGR